MSTDDKSAAFAALTFYTREEVIEMTGLSVSSLQRAMRTGKLVTHKFGRTVRISPADFQAFVASARCVPSGKKKIMKSKGVERPP